MDENRVVSLRQKGAIDDPLMSGRRPLIKGFLAALRTSRVRSCLRPVDADFSPLALMVRPPGSLPQSPKRAQLAPSGSQASEPFRGSHHYLVTLDSVSPRGENPLLSVRR